MDDPHETGKLISAEEFAAARAARDGTCLREPSGKQPSKGRPPKRLAPPSRTIGRLANRQNTEKGVMIATAATFGLLQHFIAVAQILSPRQFVDLLLELAKMSRVGLLPNDMAVAQAAARIVSSDSGRTIHVADPDDHEQT